MFFFLFELESEENYSVSFVTCQYEYLLLMSEESINIANKRRRNFWAIDLVR